MQSIATGGVVWHAFVYVGNIHEPCKNWMNRSRCHLVEWLGWAQGTMYL